MKNKKVKISLNRLIELAKEVWRHDKKNKNRNQSSIPKLKRETKKFINKSDIKIYDLEGDEYDPGLSVEVIDYINKDEKKDTIIEEMISPIIIFKDEVVQMGQVIVSGPRKEK